LMNILCFLETKLRALLSGEKLLKTVATVTSFTGVLGADPIVNSTQASLRWILGRLTSDICLSEQIS
jgi:hypothetical protein